MKFLNKKLFVAAVIVMLLVAPIASAALVNCDGSTVNRETLETTCSIKSLIALVIRIINQLLSWSGLVAILFVMWAGWSMINAGGDSEQVEGAKTTLTNAIVGFFLILVAMLLVNTVVFMLTGYNFNFDKSDPNSFMKFLF